MKDIVIDTAVPADAEVIYGLILDLAQYEHLEKEVTATIEDIRGLFFGKRPFAEAIIARHQGEPVGFATFYHNVSTFAGRPGMFLEDLFVKPGHRHCGVGKALFRHVTRLAQARGCNCMEWMALEWNKPALEFYHQMGAHVRSGWVTLRLDAFSLAKTAE